MRSISRLRFDALAAYARAPQTVLSAEEVGSYEHAGERVLGVMIRDRTDNDYSGQVLARDELRQYRWVAATTFETRLRRAEALLRRELELQAMKPDEAYRQGHKGTMPVDFFKPVVSVERLNPHFRSLIEAEQ